MGYLLGVGPKRLVMSPYTSTGLSRLETTYKNME